MVARMEFGVKHSPHLVALEFYPITHQHRFQNLISSYIPDNNGYCLTHDPDWKCRTNTSFLPSSPCVLSCGRSAGGRPEKKQWTLNPRGTEENNERGKVRGGIEAIPECQISFSKFNQSLFSIDSFRRGYGNQHPKERICCPRAFAAESCIQNCGR